MPILNDDVSDILNQVADLLDIKGENPFRIRSYRDVARTLSGLSRNISDMVKEGEDLTELSGVGEDMAGKIEEIVETGSLDQLQELKKEMPAGLIDLLKLEELGPKRVKAIYDAYEVKNLDELEDLVRDHKIRELEGFGEKTENKIGDEIERYRQRGGSERVPWVKAEEMIGPLIEYLQQIDGIKNLDVAGSFRRHKETVGDIDILVSHERGTDVMEPFVSYEDVDRILGQGKTKTSVVLRQGLQVDLRVVPHVGYGAARVYFTGSKAHNVKIRTIGVKRDLKINEYGVFKDEERVAGKTEKEVYSSVGLTFIPPELREDRGEIEAAQQGKVPDLVTLDDIRGDLQSHTTETDGKATLEEMAQAARDLGHEYLAITDHSKRVTMAKGMDAKRLRQQIEQIEKLNEEFDDFRLLKAVEVDILKDGSLDLPNDVLQELDVVICSVHYDTKLSKQKQTDRIIKAMDNPVFNILAHPTGRIIGERDPYEMDLEAIMEAALDRGCFLEINAQPYRLDLSDRYVRMAKEMGLKLAISTDAHTPANLSYMRYGVAQARRGWLEKKDVLNTRPWKELKTVLKRD